MNSLQLNLNQHLWEQNQLFLELEQFLLQNNVHPKQRFKLITCVLEAVGNVLHHGKSPLDKVILIIHCSHDCLTVDLLDPSVSPELDMPSHCPERDGENGRGLWILYNWMDKVNFQHAISGTHLRLSLLRH
ncbi:ATP-binding protein [Shewanella khirikhana]|uniref:Histidine kinase/HSP90-like ATPase domain-containing protein n=1 Tax=Shewanella khirikhana TaxID=1965282 RepID=A0ABM7DAW9_9GAMM|nr:ATP-binding protein [Shewanella khirikhana]AZQ11077.1 hypothetical protein STH12_01989 [Shewanella khirikhana]